MCRSDPGKPDIRQPPPPIEAEIVAEIVTSPFAEYYRPPRLSILHLLVWTAITALLFRGSLFVAELEDHPWRGFQGEFIAVWYAMICFRDAAIGAVLVAACVLMAGKLRGVSDRLQPGHWMMLLDAPATVFTYTIWNGCYVFCKSEEAYVQTLPVHPMQVAAFAAGLVSLVRAVGLGVLALRCRDGRRWRVGFAAQAATMGMVSLLRMGSAFFEFLWDISTFLLWPGLMVSVLSVVAWLDLRRGTRRDWVHWAAVALTILQSLNWIVWWIWKSL